MDKNLYSEILNRLKQKFIDFKIDFDEFNDLLQKYNAFISGSFLLQVIQNEFYPAGSYDIDIYTFGEKNLIFEKELKNIIKKAIINKIENKETSIICKNNNYTRYKTVDFIDSEQEDESDSENGWKKEKEENIIKEKENNNIYYVDVNLLNDWNKDDIIEENKLMIRFYESTGSNRIHKNYKSINDCRTGNIGINFNYDFSKINAIVDFNVSNNIMSKYQLIYYDKTRYKTAQEIVDNFDFDFCANYWDGKKFYIKNYYSIKTKSCILKLDKPRIYKNQNNRIFKYSKRGFAIKINYDDTLFDVLLVYLNNEEKIIINEEIENLIIICEDQYILLNTVFDNLPIGLQRLIIYTYNYDNIIDNLPSCLQELRLYIWKRGSGNENSNNLIENLRMKNKINKDYTIGVKTAICKIIKVPFDCKIYINDSLIEK